MKPRFSILGLLALTAYIAINVAAFLEPRTYLPHVAFFLAFAILIVLVVLAARPSGGRSVFAKGMLLTILVFSMMRELEPVIPDTAAGAYLQFEYIYLFENPLDERSTLPNFDRAIATSNRVQICRLNTHFVVGVCGGLLALWRFRAYEQRRRGEPAES